MTTKLIVFSGPSGVGKSTIIKQLFNDDFLDAEFSISATNRKPRPNEVDGKHYHFLSTEEFQAKIQNDEFVEWEEVYPGRFYGTLKNEVERIRGNNKHVLFDIDVVGGLNIKKLYGMQAVTIIVKPPSLEVLGERLKLRGTETAESLNTRLSKAEQELSLAPQFDIQITNDDIDKTVVDAKKAISEFLH